MKTETLMKPLFSLVIEPVFTAMAVIAAILFLFATLPGCTPESFDHKTTSVDDAGRAISEVIGTRPVVVYLFRTTCPHCRKSFQQVLDTARKYPDIPFLAYSTDKSDRRLASYLADYDLPFAVQRLERWKSGQMTKAMNSAGLSLGRKFGVPLFAVFNPEGERLYQGSSIHNAEIRLKRLISSE